MINFIILEWIQNWEILLLNKIKLDLLEILIELNIIIDKDIVVALVY